MTNRPTYEELEQKVRELEKEAGNRKKSEETLKRKRLESVLEMAGTVCHEMSQPMQTILGNCELLLMDMDEHDPFYDRINTIKTQMDRMSTLTKKLMNIREYRTVQYSNGTIIDIHEAPE